MNAIALMKNAVENTKPIVFAKPFIVTIFNLLMTVACSSLVYGDVYRCRNDNGGLIYQDFPCAHVQHAGNEGPMLSTSGSFAEIVYKCEVKSKQIATKRHTYRAKCIITGIERVRSQKYIPPELASLFRQVDAHRLLLAERIDNNEITETQAKSMFYDYVDSKVNNTRVISSIEKIGDSMESLATTARQPVRIAPFTCNRIGGMVHCF